MPIWVAPSVLSKPTPNASISAAKYGVIPTSVGASWLSIMSWPVGLPPSVAGTKSYVGHSQTMLLQTWPAAHGLSHAPQWSGSFVRSSHVPSGHEVIVHT